jgi:hypothetical protein
MAGDHPMGTAIHSARDGARRGFSPGVREAILEHVARESAGMSVQERRTLIAAKWRHYTRDLAEPELSALFTEMFGDIV